MTPILRYHIAMKSKPQSEEYMSFESLLSTVLAVPKAEITRRIEEDKREKELNKLRVPKH